MWRFFALSQHITTINYSYFVGMHMLKRNSFEREKFLGNSNHTQDRLFLELDEKIAVEEFN